MLISKSIPSQQNILIPILAVIVLYKRAFEETPAHDFILSSLKLSTSMPGGFCVAAVLVYDNSPETVPSSSIDDSYKINYVHDSNNGGTRAAYVRAAIMAKELGLEWVLLLDHDTHLPGDFLIKSHEALRTIKGRRMPPAIFPWVTDHGIPISPNLISRSGRCRPLCPNKDSLLRLGPNTLSAIASGSIIRTDALFALIPIPLTFNLDYLDHWMFRELQEKFGDAVISQAQLQHSLSLNDYNHLSTERYGKILKAEYEFLRSADDFSSVLYMVHHTMRTLRQILRGVPRRLIAISLRHLRLLVSIR
jgi:hypothetical protein